MGNSNFFSAQLAGSPNFLAGLDEEMIEVVDADQAEAREFHVRSGVQRG
jgi:hypothetical protein